MKKLTIVLTSFGILILVLPLGTYAYVKYELYTLKNQTYDYLLEKGYEEADIRSLDTGIQKLSLFTAFVVFEDEPEITYNYKKNDDGDIIQIGWSTSYKDLEYKHSEDPDRPPLNYIINLK